MEDMLFLLLYGFMEGDDNIIGLLVFLFDYLIVGGDGGVYGWVICGEGYEFGWGL